MKNNDNPRAPERAIERWLQLSDTGSLAWSSRIWKAVADAGKNPVPYEMGRLGYAITLKLELIQALLGRLDDECGPLFESAKAYEDRQVCTPQNPIKDRCEFRFDGSAQCRLLIDADSLFFEVDSCCELTGKFLCESYSHMGVPHNRKTIGNVLQRILTERGLDSQWFSLLKRERNFFIHEGAALLAVDITDPKCDLIIMKGNCRTFDDPQQYVTGAKLKSLARTFWQSTYTVQRYIVELYESPSYLREEIALMAKGITDVRRSHNA